MARGLILRLVASVAAGLLLGGAILLGLRLSGGGTGPALEEPVTVRAALSAPTVLFGDPLDARVDVLVDRSRVDPESVRVLGDFAPFRVRTTTRTRTDSGDTTSLRWELELLCLERACLPKQGQPKPVRLERGFVLWGPSGREALNWPGVEVASRLSAADRVRPALRLADAPPPAATFRVSPSLVSALLLGLAALLALGAIALLTVEVRRVLARRRSRDPLFGLAPVARALALLDRARTPDERRRALDRLARAVEDEELSEEARTLAWSAPMPDQPDAAAVAAKAAPR